MVDDREVSKTLEKLHSLLSEKKLIVFDEIESAALREVAAFWLAFHRTGRVILWFRHPVMWIGWILSAYFAFKAGGIADMFKVLFK